MDIKSLAWPQATRLRQSLKGSINGHKKLGLAPSDKVIAAILDDIQPYIGGKLGLYGLHELDITDKHIVLIPTSTSMTIERLDIPNSAGAKYIIQGFTLKVEKPYEGGEFLELGEGGAIFHGNPKNAIKILFQKRTALRGR